jgi:hypothetical protein
MSDDTETFAKKSTRSKRRNSKRSKSCSNEDAGDDFPSMMTDMFKGIPWKVSFFLFILMIFIFSDIYIELFLNSIPGAVEGDCPTTKGTVTQIVTTIICYMILDLLVQGGFL